MDLLVEIIMTNKDTVKIPPLLSVFVNLQHEEYFVKVTGTIFYHSRWNEINDLSGVMEEHFGVW